MLAGIIIGIGCHLYITNVMKLEPWSGRFMVVFIPSIIILNALVVFIKALIGG